MRKHLEGNSDKTISGALKNWRRGALGTLGLQYFYAGRKDAGVGQCLMGIFLWALFIRAFFEEAVLSSRLVFAAFIAIVLAAVSIRGYVKIKRGKLTDEYGRTIAVER